MATLDNAISGFRLQELEPHTYLVGVLLCIATCAATGIEALIPRQPGRNAHCFQLAALPDERVAYQPCGGSHPAKGTAVSE